MMHEKVHDVVWAGDRETRFGRQAASRWKYSRSGNGDLLKFYRCRSTQHDLAGSLILIAVREGFLLRQSIGDSNPTLDRI